MQPHFENIDSWVFDLDNTLYPPQARLFDQIEVRMTNFVMKALNVDQPRANHLRKHYWQKYGTTLSGLMREHQIDPQPYLVEVHDISLHNLTTDPDLRSGIQNLPGRKIVYTNGSEFHAMRVLKARGLEGVFDAVYGIEHAEFFPKPEKRAFETIFTADGLQPTSAVMFEDDLRNLAVPFEMGMGTVYISAAGNEGTKPDFVTHQTDDLSQFLAAIMQ